MANATSCSATCSRASNEVPARGPARPKMPQSGPELSLTLSGIAAHCDPSFCRDWHAPAFCISTGDAPCQSEPRNSLRQSSSTCLRVPPWRPHRTTRHRPPIIVSPRRLALCRKAAIGITASIGPPNATAGMFENLRKARHRTRPHRRPRFRRRKRSLRRHRSRTRATKCPCRRPASSRTRASRRRREFQP